MGKFLFKAWQFIRFYLSAKTIYKIDSPFAFDIISTVFDKSKQYYIFDKLENKREKLKQNKRIIHFEDLGALSHTLDRDQLTISDIERPH